ncbi:MAG TPA: hypothetical protein VFE28_08965 [Candidatus Krumholzibacteria bacterium]|jgi:hypothetical protein|nr:hypothetical protein [Candidatus Krumholzibacteria bacterium]
MMTKALLIVLATVFTGLVTGTFGLAGTEDCVATCADEEAASGTPCALCPCCHSSQGFLQEQGLDLPADLSRDPLPPSTVASFASIHPREILHVPKPSGPMHLG